MPTLTTSTEHSTGSTSKSNETRNKRHEKRKGGYYPSLQMIPPYIQKALKTPPKHKLEPADPVKLWGRRPAYKANGSASAHCQPANQNRNRAWVWWCPSIIPARRG